MKRKILMVCLGNICRSPLAEGILKDYVQRHNLNWLVESAGTSAYHNGNPPDRRSIEVAKHKGIDISAQRSRLFSTNDFDEFDHIYVMDKANLYDVQKKGRDENDDEKVSLILEGLTPNEVPDPYYGGENGFHYVYELLDKACQKIVQPYV